MYAEKLVQAAITMQSDLLHSGVGAVASPTELNSRLFLDSLQLQNDELRYELFTRVILAK